MSIGFLGGLSVALPGYGFKILPVGHFLVCVYAAIVTFAIKKANFLDIRLSLGGLLAPFLVVVLSLAAYCLFHFHLNLFALAGLLLGAACFTLAYVIFAHAHQKTHYIWGILNISAGIWGAGTFLVGISNNENTALIAWKIAYVGILSLSVIFYHMIYIFCGLQDRKFLYFAYWQMICVLLINIFTNLNYV